jgi:hypothetical protein
MRACAILAVLFVGSLAAAADEKPAVKELSAKDLKLNFPRGGKATAPATVASAEDLAKNDVVKDAADDIKKQVDFAKEKLVVFAWGGSGQDKLAADLKTADKKTTALFSYTRGLTRDFRMHTHLYVVPKDAEVKVEAAK